MVEDQSHVGTGVADSRESRDQFNIEANSRSNTEREKALVLLR